MQALSDEQQTERLEKKVDEGFAEMRSEFRAIRAEMANRLAAQGSELSAIGQNIRTMLLTLIFGLAGLFVTVIFGFAAIVLTHA